MGLGETASCRSSCPGCWRSLYGEEQLQRGRLEGSPNSCALCPLSATHTRAGEDAGGVSRASSHDDEFLLSVWRQSTQRFFASVLKNQFNRRAQARHALLSRPALTVRARHFGAVCDVPWAILLDYRRELIAHIYILACKSLSKSVSHQSCNPRR